MSLSKEQWIQEIQTELKENILPWWPKVSDPAGGWPGDIDRQGKAHPAPKGVVMHSRFLWAYSAAARNLGESRWLEYAVQAKDFLLSSLKDKKNGGFYWMINKDGKALRPQKVIYGQAFAVYGLSEYYRVTADPEALKEAFEVFNLVEKHAKDPVHGGYYEAVSDDWSQIVPNALGDDDVVCEKSMNTNLHVLEAWTALYLASKDPAVAEAVKALVDIHVQKIRVEPAHFGLFFDSAWKSSHSIRSFGHDIEGTWLIKEAADAVWGQKVPSYVDEAVLTMAKKTLEILKDHGPGLINEEENGHFDQAKIWWVQAECMVGLLNAWQMTKDEIWYSEAQNMWGFIKTHIVDSEAGEWFWGCDAQGKPYADKSKGGLWKTPYHNGRACMEALHRLGAEL